LEVKNQSLIPVEQSNFQWVYYLLIGMASIFVLGKLIYPKRMNQSLFAMFSNRVYNPMEAEGLIAKHALNIMLSLVYIMALSIAMALYTSIEDNVIHTIQWNLNYSFQIMAIFAVSLLLKILFILISQWIYQAKMAAIHYLNILFVSHGLLGLSIMLGIWISINFTPQFGISFTLGLTGLLFAYRLVKLLLSTSSKIKFRLFHFIVYLCTVEILPLVIILKLYSYRVL
jgi:hypothetical protein